MPTVLEFLNLLISQKGDRYVFGIEVAASNSNPDAFDCAELVQWGCGRLKLKPTMPDGSWIQAHHCFEILQPDFERAGLAAPRRALIYLFFIAIHLSPAE